jgi:hypothetical protein
MLVTPFAAAHLVCFGPNRPRPKRLSPRRLWTRRAEIDAHGQCNAAAICDARGDEQRFRSGTIGQYGQAGEGCSKDRNARRSSRSGLLQQPRDPRVPRSRHHSDAAQAADVGRQIGGALRQAGLSLLAGGGRPIAVQLGRDCRIAIQTKKTARCCGATGPRPVKIVRSNRNAQPGQSGGLHDGSMSICSRPCSSASSMSVPPFVPPSALPTPARFRRLGPPMFDSPRIAS